MQTIETKYIGPTDTRGGRIRARSQGHRISLAWDHGLSDEENHDRAALALARKMGVREALYGGGRPDGKGNCYVFASGRVRRKKARHGGSR